MTNLEKWRFFSEPFPTHHRYITMSFYWMIGAALQRRVWLDSKLMQTFPNNYMLFVGEPGVGKTMLTSKVQKMFLSILEDNTKKAATLDEIQKLSSKTLFPLSADSTSFEAFVEFTSKAMRTVRHGEGNRQQYLHCSPAFILDEAASIFDKDAGKMCTFLLSGWTCSEQYSRNTIGRGEDMIMNLCVNLIGGIQPGKLKALSQIDIIDNGFSRRCLMVYADKVNKHVAFIEHTQEQEDAYFELYPYIRSLSKLYGQVNITPDARAWMIDRFSTNIEKPLNKSHHLAAYYTTKGQHVKKLAMCVHFADSLDMTIGVESFIEAKAILDELEPSMHMGYTGGKDTRGELIQRIRTLLKSSPEGLTGDELFVDAFDLADRPTFEQTLGDLIQARQIIQTPTRNYILTK